MPKKESRTGKIEREEKETFSREEEIVKSDLQRYIQAVNGKPRISKEEINKRLKTSASDYEKSRILSEVLNPLTQVLRVGFLKPAEEAKSAISVRDAFDLYKELAQIYEQNQNFREAQTNYAMASLIAKKARANETAKNLYNKTREMEKLSGARGTGQGYAPTNEEIIRDYENARTELVLERRGIKPKSLESNVEAVASIIGVVGGLLFLSSSLTGNVQLSPGASAFNWRLWLGIALILIGIVFGWFWMKRKK